jgi:hypothetical protein
MIEADREMVRALLRALHMRRAAVSGNSGGELWVHEDGTRITLSWGVTEWGVMFNDGSVMHPWNGRTQRERAEEEAARHHREYPNDTITVVCRSSGSDEWRLPS